MQRNDYDKVLLAMASEGYSERDMTSFIYTLKDLFEPNINIDKAKQYIQKLKEVKYVIREIRKYNPSYVGSTDSTIEE